MSKIIAQGPVDANVSRIAELIEQMEREAFEKWWGEPPTELEPLSKRSAEDRVSLWAWQAWKARAAHQRPCRGVAHRGCDYLAPCGSICDKCGQQT